MIKHEHLLLVHSVVNFLRMLTMTCLTRMRKKMREMMFTFQIMFTLMETIEKGKHLRYQLHILKLEGRNPQRKLERLQDCPIK
ncbi:hypothetical protein Gotri_012799 [Gossypium trilobum]|uniref:Uncharacterized protein n=2 Tax=Gossypium trilobum TaxID=34281 RepID=A0A7J9DRJ8_9ROSI|nr:hypothetical protein [Gossypium trilobum]